MIEDEILNKHYNDAVPIMEAAKIRYRIVSDDGKTRMLTADYKPNRLNIYLEKGIIVKIDRG